MFNIDDDTVLVGATELRNNMPKISKDIKLKKIIVVKKGKPFAVLTDFDEFQEKEEIINTFEDLVLGHLAKERDEHSSDSDFIDSEKIEKKLGI
ncbi:hypothetical protein GF354_06355 [Candidatus Peregrinibacteria bacterium]|nr:hypothetical protein [Candidatus Peregrinibacteria bacterium]